METTKNGWTIIDSEAAVLTYEYVFNDNGGRAKTFVAKLDDGTLLVISPGVDMPDAAFEDLATFGEVSSVVAPSGFHTLGIAQWRKRFDNARFYAPEDSVKRMAKKAPEAGKLEPLSALLDRLGPDVGMTEAPGSKCGESWAWVKTDSGIVWFASDMLCNWDSFPGNFLLNLMWKATKSGPGYRVFHFAMMPIIKDKKAALTAFVDDLRANPPAVVVPSHGAILSHDGLAEETIAMVSSAL